MYIEPIEGPQVLNTSIIWMRVCVPNDWTDDQIAAFAERENPSGTVQGWRVCRGENRYTKAKPVVQCEEFAHKVHVVLDTLIRTDEEADPDAR